MGATLDIVKHVVRTDYSNLPQEVIEKTKAFILDSLGVAFAGSSAPGCKSLVDHILYWEGKSEATVWLFGGKVPAFHAALANATMAHAREFDDTHEETGMHCFAAILSAALAAAEQRKKASGKKLITAVALGADISCRLGQSINLSYSWHPTTVLGTYGAAVAAGKMLELDEEKMLNAIGIAHAHIPGGNRQGREDGALTKRMQPGFAAMEGVLSANLTLSGLTGAKAAFEGVHGFFNLYRNHGDKFDPDTATEKLLAGLGRRYEVTNLSIKPYPACRSSHPAIDAALSIVNSERIMPDQIEIINVYVSGTSMEKVGKPVGLWTNPQVDAQFSIPYTVAVALLQGEVVLDDFEEDKLKNTEILQLAERIKCFPKQDLMGRTPVTLEIKTKRGETYSKTVNVMKGEPDKPLSKEERLRKLRNCCSYAAKPLSQDKMDNLILTVDRLEKLNNVSELVALLT